MIPPHVFQTFLFIAKMKSNRNQKFQVDYPENNKDSTTDDTRHRTICCGYTHLRTTQSHNK